MSSIESQYQALLIDIIQRGAKKQDRTGTGTLSLFGRQIRHRMSDGFPLLTTKKMHWKSIVTELLWFLRGDTNIRYLVDNGCHIWDGDAYKNFLKGWEHAKTVQKSMSTPEQYELYLSEIKILSKEEFIERIKTDPKFAAKWSELGPIYGAQWRKWGTFSDLCVDHEYNDGTQVGSYKPKSIDQIANAINLLKTDPDSRRNIVSAWNVGELDQMVLPPCHNFFQFYTREMSFEERCKYAGFEDAGGIGQNGIREKIESDPTIPTRAVSLMWNQRSVDTFLGLPFNIASYALLLEIVAKEVNMVPDELIGTLGDTHLYLNHIEQAKEQITREPYELPRLRMNDGPPSIIEKPMYWKPEDFWVENYKSHPGIKAPLSN